MSEVGQELVSRLRNFSESLKGSYFKELEEVATVCGEAASRIQTGDIERNHCNKMIWEVLADQQKTNDLYRAALVKADEMERRANLKSSLVGDLNLRIAGLHGEIEELERKIHQLEEMFESSQSERAEYMRQRDRLVERLHWWDGCSAYVLEGVGIDDLWEFIRGET